MNGNVSVKKRELFDITIYGVEFKGMEKTSSWKSFEEYTGEGGSRLILASFGMESVPHLSWFLGDLFGKGREYHLIAGDAPSMDRLQAARTKAENQPEEAAEQAAA
jgi:hypothetical protein